MKRKCSILCFSVVSVLLISVLASCTAQAKPDSNASTGSSLSSSADGKVLPGGSSGSYFRDMATDSSALDRWKSTYTKLDGWITRGFTFTKDSDGKCILQVDVTTKSGELDITVMDSAGKELYSYKNITTSTFDVNLSSGGNYQIRVDARNHDGGFSIRQKTHDAGN